MKNKYLPSQPIFTLLFNKFMCLKKKKKKDDINFFISFDPSISMFCADDLRGASNHDFMFNYQVPEG